MKTSAICLKHYVIQIGEWNEFCKSCNDERMKQIVTLVNDELITSIRGMGKNCTVGNCSSYKVENI